MSPKRPPRSIDALTRREALIAGGLSLAGIGIGLPSVSALPPRLVEIRMRSVNLGEHVQFDPLGILVQPGDVIRWIVEADVHTTTAYHPQNDDHPLRIPETAMPWDSGYLVDPGATFEVTLTVEGVYDYFCAPHEQAGMVGRIIVGRPGGPGAVPFADPSSRPEGRQWRDVPQAARETFPSVEEIMARRVVSRTI